MSLLRLPAPHFCNRFETWNLTVLSEMQRSSPISRFDIPLATKVATCCCLVVRCFSCQRVHAVDIDELMLVIHVGDGSNGIHCRKCWFRRRPNVFALCLNA